MCDDCGCGDSELVPVHVHEHILADNDSRAAHLREHFVEAKVLAINLMGFVGGLVMSAIKRDRGVKDWGALIEGHGGMLDRVDSVCFSAPIFFHAVRYFWVP